MTLVCMNICNVKGIGNAIRLFLGVVRVWLHEALLLLSYFVYHIRLIGALMG